MTMNRPADMDTVNAFYSKLLTAPAEVTEEIFYSVISTDLVSVPDSTRRPGRRRYVQQHLVLRTGSARPHLGATGDSAERQPVHGPQPGNRNTGRTFPRSRAGHRKELRHHDDRHLDGRKRKGRPLLPRRGFGPQQSRNSRPPDRTPPNRETSMPDL